MNLDYNYVLDFASAKHEGQFRADGVTPYINHPIMVARLVKEFKQSSKIEHLVAASLLHDTLEDTYTSYRELEDEFGVIVASLVLELTTASYMVQIMGKAQYLEKKMATMSDYALIIKFADRLANIMDSEALSLEKRIKLRTDTTEIINYLEQNRSLTNTQKRLIVAIREAMDKHLPLNELTAG